MKTPLTTNVRRAVRRVRLAPDTWRTRRPPTFVHPKSQIATAAQMRDASYRQWANVMGERSDTYNRKVWEWAYTLQAFDELGLLRPGRRVLGFGCGTEPLPALFAARGVEVVATDQAADEAGEWATTNQHAASIAALRRPELCADSEFDRLVSFRPADMRAISPEFRGFDGVWSSCAFEHLGSIQAGLDFVLESMACLRPGGYAVHTTEFDVDDHDPAIDLGAVVLYRRRDIEALVLELRHRGHRVRCNFHLPDEAEDAHVDEPPYSDVHVRVRVGPAASTSLGLIVQRNPKARW